MIVIDKQRLKIKVGLDDSFDNISTTIYNTFKDLEQEINQDHRSQFLDEIELYPTAISFILGAITSGFLKKIGEEIWIIFKKVFIKSNQKQVNPPSFEFKFKHQGTEIVAEVESNDPQELELAFNNLNQILKSVTDKQEDDKLRFVLDSKEKKWVKKVK